MAKQKSYQLIARDKKGFIPYASLLMVKIVPRI